MNKYLVKKKDAKYLRRLLVLGRVEWTEEIDSKGKIWFSTDIEEERFKRLAKGAKADRKAEEEEGFLSVKFEMNPKKPGVVHCMRAMMDRCSIRRIDEETMHKYIRLMEEENNCKYTDEEIEEKWILKVSRAEVEDSTNNS